MGADGLPDEGDGGVLNAVACHVAEALGVDAEAVGRDGHRAEARDDTDEQHLRRREGRTLSGQRCTHPPEVAQAGGGDAPAAGLSDAKRAVPQQQDAQRQQTAHDGGESRAQRCARHREACAPDRDALAEQHQLPGGVDEEEVEHHVQRADQHADEAGGQGVAGGPEHGAIHPHRHGEGEGRRPDGEVGAGIGLERDVRPQPPGQEAADADTESRSAQTQDEVEEHGLPMAAVASAPMWPTMAASMYSIAVTTSCSRMEGMLSASAMRAVSDSGMSSPCRIRAESCSRESVMSSPVFCVDKVSYYYRHGEENCQTGRLIFWLWRDTLSE